jgi:hypothetical protein
VCVAFLSLSLSLSLKILNFDLVSSRPSRLFFVLNLLQKCEREEYFPHAQRKKIKHNNVKLNVFVWKTERRFEDRASVAEKKKERRRVQLFFVFFFFLRSEERYCFLRFVVR